MRNLIRYQELGDYSQTDLAGFFAKNFFFFFANLLRLDNSGQARTGQAQKAKIQV